MKRIRRIVATILSVTMLCSMSNITVFAKEEIPIIDEGLIERVGSWSDVGGEPTNVQELQTGNTYKSGSVSYGGSLKADSTWLKIIPTENTYTKIEFKGESNITELPRWDVLFYKEDGTEFGYEWNETSDYSFKTREIMLGDNVPYYIKVYYEGAQAGSYNFEITAEQESLAGWEKEPNDDFASANKIMAEVELKGSTVRGGDYDCYEFIAPFNGDINIITDCQQPDFKFRVYDSEYPERLEPYLSANTIKEMTVKKGEKYYIKVDSQRTPIVCDSDLMYTIKIHYVTKELANGFHYIKDTWSFENLTTKIPRGTYRMFFDEAQTDEMMRGTMDGTGGHCYGMALTVACSYLNCPSTMSYEFNNTCLNDINVNARSSQTKCKAVDYIDAAFIFQDRDEVQAVKHANLNDINGLVEAVRNFEEEKGNPPIICVYGGGEAGHALLGLSIENETSSKMDILVYDCNYPNQKKYLIVNKENDEYTGWSYNIFSDGTIWSSTQQGAHISYADVATKFVEMFNAGEAQNNKTPLVLMIVHTKNGELYYQDTKYDLDKEPELSYTEYVRYIDECRGTTNNNEKKYWLKGDSSEVKFKNLEKDSEVSLSKGKLRIAASSSDVSDITIDLASQSVSVDDGENATFDVCYSNFSDYYNVNKFDIIGDASGKAEIKQNDGAIVIKGVEEFSVNCNSERYSDSASTQKINEIKTSVKELDKDATYQIKETTANGILKLTVSEDKDGDGVFEKVVASSQVATVTPKPTTTSKPVVNNTPKSTSLSKLSAKGKTVKVTWKKQTSNVAGYQIQYATNKKFTKAKTKTITKNKTTSLTVKKLKANTKYYVRVRTYNKVNGKKVYSAWSKAKTVKTKK